MLIAAFFVLILISCATNGTAVKTTTVSPQKFELDMYANAPQDVREAITRCDMLIKQAKYASALRALSIDEDLGKDRDYIIYKWTEVITNWFSFSMMHTMFDIKDFNSEEELYAYRRDISYGNKEMSFNLTIDYSGPEGRIDEYEKVFGETPRTNLARAQYYFDVSQRYKDQWLKSYDELLSLAYENYRKAIAGNFYDLRALENFAQCALLTSHFQEAYEGYKQLVAYKPDFGNYWYNYALSSMYIERYNEAIDYCTQAIQYPEENEFYQMDAYLLLSNIYLHMGDTKKAEETMIKLTHQYPEKPYALQYYGQFYYKYGKTTADIEKAIQAFNDCIRISWKQFGRVNEIADITRYLVSAGDLVHSHAILQNAKALVTSNNEVSGIVYYFDAQVYAMEGNKAEARKTAEQAQFYFKEANNIDALNELSNFIKSLDQ